MISTPYSHLSLKITLKTTSPQPCLAPFAANYSQRPLSISRTLLILSTGSLSCPRNWEMRPRQPGIKGESTTLVKAHRVEWLKLTNRNLDMPLSSTANATTFDFMASILKDLVQEGMIEESEVDSFNMPLYNSASPEDIKDLVERNGCFTIERLELSKPSSWLDNKEMEQVEEMIQSDAATTSPKGRRSDSRFLHWYIRHENRKMISGFDMAPRASAIMVLLNIGMGIQIKLSAIGRYVTMLMLIAQGLEHHLHKKPAIPMLISFDVEEVRKQAAALTKRFEEGTMESNGSKFQKAKIP
uniref:Uncharacterized protein n=1 Tax=Cannabis sativa TaxID=3483 RepID=A0A803Q3K3_CANSA